MSAIEDLSLSQMTTNELSTTGSSLVTIITPLRDDTFIDRVATRIMTTVEQYSMIPGTPQAKEDSSNIQGMDAEIDRILPMLETTLKANVEQFAYFREKALASKELLKGFELCDRRELMYGNYANQEAQLNKLFSHVLADSMTANREASGTAPIWTALKKWNDKLRELLVKRLNSGKLEVTSKDVRRELKYRIEGMLSYLEMNITDEIEGFPAVQDSVNELIAEVMGKVRARKTRKENEDVVSEEEAVVS